MALTPGSLTKISSNNRDAQPGAIVDLPAVILAAGFSQRMGQIADQKKGYGKLLLPFRGQPILAHAVQNALNCGVLAPLLIVIGPHTPPQVSEIISGLAPKIDMPRPDVSIVTAYNAALGQAESLKAGLSAALTLCPDAPGVAVLLGDQPLISPALLQTLHGQFFAANAITPTSVAPSFDGQRGNPVFLPRELFPAIAKLSGDHGARSLLAALPLRLVSWPDNSCLRDVDTPDQYASLLH